jgi:hypothetical protein
MTKGVVLFALNNSEIDYISLAKFSAKKVKQFLNVPVALITDKESAESCADLTVFDHVIIIQQDTNYYNRKFKDGITSAVHTHWKNTHRATVFDVTPFDETLVIDVDYIINSSILNYCWDQPHDFLIYKKSKDLAGWRSNSEFTQLSDYSIPFYWATVFYFKKTQQTSYFFSLINHIKDNWQYYKFLYQISSANFRNDYAFSIAIHMMNGFTSGDFAKELPGKMYYTLDKDYLLKIKGTSFYFVAQKNQDIYFPLTATNLDIHVMNKYSLLRNINE